MLQKTRSLLRSENNSECPPVEPEEKGIQICLLDSGTAGAVG